MLIILKKFLVSANIIAKVKKLWNIDISDYVHTIDQDGVNHVYNRHGHKSKEIEHNKIDESDIDLIEFIVNGADEIVAGGLSGSRKLPTVMYIKYIDDYKYYYIEEILVSKKELRIKTIFKNKKMP